MPALHEHALNVARQLLLLLFPQLREGVTLAQASDAAAAAAATAALADENSAESGEGGAGGAGAGGAVVSACIAAGLPAPQLTHPSVREALGALDAMANELAAAVDALSLQYNSTCDDLKCESDSRRRQQLVLERSVLQLFFNDPKRLESEVEALRGRVREHGRSACVGGSGNGG